MTKQQSSYPFFDNSVFSDAFQSLSSFSPTSFDLSTVSQTMRKNFEAFSEVQKLALNNCQKLAAQQTEFTSQALNDSAQFFQDMLNEGTPENKLAKQADAVKQSYEQAVINCNKIGDMIRKSQNDAAKVINTRVVESLDETSQAAQPQKAAS